MSVRIQVRVRVPESTVSQCECLANISPTAPSLIQVFGEPRPLRVFGFARVACFHFIIIVVAAFRLKAAKSKENKGREKKKKAKQSKNNKCRVIAKKRRRKRNCKLLFLLAAFSEIKLC